MKYTIKINKQALKKVSEAAVKPIEVKLNKIIFEVANQKDWKKHEQQEAIKILQQRVKQEMDLDLPEDKCRYALFPES